MNEKKKMTNKCQTQLNKGIDWLPIRCSFKGNQTNCLLVCICNRSELKVNVCALGRHNYFIIMAWCVCYYYFSLCVHCLMCTVRVMYGVEYLLGPCKHGAIKIKWTDFDCHFVIKWITCPDRYAIRNIQSNEHAAHTKHSRTLSLCVCRLNERNEMSKTINTGRMFFAYLFTILCIPSSIDWFGFACHKGCLNFFFFASAFDMWPCELEVSHLRRMQYFNKKLRCAYEYGCSILKPFFFVSIQHLIQTVNQNNLIKLIKYWLCWPLFHSVSIFILI